MNTLSKPSENLGGISQLFAIPVADFSILSNPIYSGYRYLTLSTWDNAWQILAQYQSISHTENVKDSSAGIHFAHSVKAKLLNDRVEVAQMLASLKNKKWIIVYQAQNGEFKMVGTNKTPLRFSYQKSTGSKIADGNTIDIEFGGLTQYESYLITNPFIPAPEIPAG